MSTFGVTFEKLNAITPKIMGSTVPTRLTTSNPPKRLDPWDGPKIALAIGACTGIALFATSIWALPLPIVLPVFSVFAICVAIIAASLAWWTSQHLTTSGLNYWDVSGVMTIVGVFAALLSDPEQVLPLLEARQLKD
jgi:hypothetical protein